MKIFFITFILIIIINLIVLIKTKGDLLQEELKDDGSGSIALWIFFFFPIGAFKAIKYREKNNKPWFIKYLLWFFMPFGIYLLWKENTFKNNKKLRLTILSIVNFIVILFLGFMLETYNLLYQNSKYNMSNNYDTEINIEEEQEILYPFSENGRVGYIDKDGEIRVKPIYDAGAVFSNGLGMVLDGRNIKYINSEGTEVIVLLDDMNGESFSNNVAIIQYDYSYYSIIDKEGNFLTDLFEGFIYRFNDGYTTFYNESGCGIIDCYGNIVLDNKYKFLGQYSEGLIAMMDEKGKYGYIDLEGNIIIEPKYTRALEFHDGLAIVATGIGDMATEITDYKVIDKSGKVVKDLNVNWIHSFSEGKYQFGSVDFNKSGYIKSSGEILIDDVYKVAYDFKEGLAAVKNDEDKVGFINENNEVVIPFKYEWCISDFKGGIAIVQDEDNNFIYIDKNGKEIFKGEAYEMLNNDY